MGWFTKTVNNAEAEADQKIKDMVDIINRKKYSLNEVVGSLVSKDKSLVQNQYMLIYKVIERIIQTDERYSTYHITSYEYKQIIEQGANFPKVATITRLVSKVL